MSPLINSAAPPSAATASRSPLGVGIIGAGPVAQAIHLPTLARLQHLFTVQNVMDVNSEIASTVAARVGARPSTSPEELLADEGVEVVAICSPNQFHARQVIASMRAGKKAILCEKPFAVTRAEAEQIAEVSAETRVPIIVGAMHAYDPGWLALRTAWGDLPDTAHTIRSRIILPRNLRFEDWATEVITRPTYGQRDLSSPDLRAATMGGGVLGLAIHDLPLVRAFIPDSRSVTVAHARFITPSGYVIGLTAGGRTIQLTGGSNSQWDPSWVFEVTGDNAFLHIEFTPSYVHAGSAVATLTVGDTTTTFGPFDFNGYEGEWRSLHDAASGQLSPQSSLDSLISDLTFAIDISEGAAALARKEITK